MRATALKLVVCATLLLGACDGGPSEPAFVPEGSLSFAYQGPISGSYEATGVMEVQAGTLPQPVTGATAYRQDQLVNLLAFRAQSATRGDAFLMLLGQVAGTGQVSLDPIACQQQVLEGCRIGFFVPDVEVTQLQGPELPAGLLESAYVMVLGAVNVTTRTDRRIKGTFQGAAFRGGEQSLQNVLAISNGRFDLPVRPQGAP
ncbi:MAG: hypothetical protein KY467_00580 [Gemmatimonadetes bacterium]|nr:hypothetical protein [Gemmatimonadota bacterium]